MFSYLTNNIADYFISIKPIFHKKSCNGSATSFAIFGNWTANAIVSYTFPVMLSGLGAPVTFFIYGIINIAIIFFVAKYVCLKQRAFHWKRLKNCMGLFKHLTYL